jgi:hypothetical protein
LQAVLIQQSTNLPDLLFTYQITETVFKTYNRLLGNQLPAGKWIILPFYARVTIPPTPSPTPRPSS